MNRLFENTKTPFNSFGNPIGAIGSITSSVSYHILSTGPTDAVWPAANAAIFIPFRVVEPTLVINLMVGNGAAVAGNIDLGIYSIDGVRLVSTGSTAHSGTSANQKINCTDTLIGPGCYYFACALDDGTTAQLNRTTLSAPLCKLLGLAEQTSAFPLPATATFATSTYGYIPQLSFGTSGSGL